MRLALRYYRLQINQENLLEIDVDNMGNVYAIKKGSKSDRVMVAAHMDEISFVVTSIDEEGYVRFSPLGGFDPKTLTAQRIIIHGKKDGVNFGKVQYTLFQAIFVAISLHNLTDKNLVFGEINGFYKFTFHIYGALVDHWGGFQFSVKCFEEFSFIDFFPGNQSAVIGFCHKRDRW